MTIPCELQHTSDSHAFIVTQINRKEEDLVEEEEETEEELSDVPPEKPKLIKAAHTIDLLERWSHFDKNGGEMKKSSQSYFKEIG